MKDGGFDVHKVYVESIVKTEYNNKSYVVEGITFGGYAYIIDVDTYSEGFKSIHVSKLTVIQSDELQEKYYKSFFNLL